MFGELATHLSHDGGFLDLHLGHMVERIPDAIEGIEHYEVRALTENGLKVIAEAVTEFRALASVCLVLKIVRKVVLKGLVGLSGIVLEAELLVGVAGSSLVKEEEVSTSLKKAADLLVDLEHRFLSRAQLSSLFDYVYKF